MGSLPQAKFEITEVSEIMMVKYKKNLQPQGYRQAEGNLHYKRMLANTQE